MLYQIKHTETLVGYFDIEGKTEADALLTYNDLVNEGKIDFGDIEMVESNDEVVGPIVKIGSEWRYKDHKDMAFVVTEISETGISGISLENGAAIRMSNLYFVEPTGRYFPEIEIMLKRAKEEVGEEKCR